MTKDHLRLGCLKLLICNSSISTNRDNITRSPIKRAVTTIMLVLVVVITSTSIRIRESRKLHQIRVKEEEEQSRKRRKSRASNRSPRIATESSR